MKTGIHPQANQITVTCSGCNASYMVTSTLPTFSVEVCSNCHPLFTGVEKFIDTEGRIEKFQKRASMKVESKKKETLKKEQAPRSLKEMLQEVRKTAG